MREGKGQSPPPSPGARKQDPKRKEGTRRPQQLGSQEFLGGWLITHTGRIRRGVPCDPGGAGGGGARLWTRSEVAGRTLRMGGLQEELRIMANSG